MERREFIKTSVVVPTAIAVLPTVLSANAFGIVDKSRKFSVKNSYSFAPSNQIVRAWIPLPKDEPSYQKVVNIAYKGNYDEVKVVKNGVDNSVLYAKWSKSKGERTLDLDFSVVTMPRSTNFSKATGKNTVPNDLKHYLVGTQHIPLNDKIKKFANDITKGAKTPIEKAKKLYIWITTTMYRDESVRGCGVGDAGKAIEEKLFGGKCTDISSVFVALLRNSGIAAREVFGIRAGQSLISGACGKADEKGFANITGGQHCRVEFYIDGIGWVPSDPADVAKVKLAEKLSEGDKKLTNVRDYFFGSWEMNWIAFNSSRDFVLNPKPAQYPLNMLGYPYAEDGEDTLDYYDPTNFSYKYSSQESL